MKKSEAETAIRHLCHEWAREIGVSPPVVDQPNFSAFTSWLHTKGFGQYLTFRSVAGPLYDVEMWFDQEFKQTWRN